MSAVIEQEMERMRFRREELGVEEWTRRQTLRDQAQEICIELCTRSKRTVEVERILTQAEELREMLDAYHEGDSQ